MIRINKWSDSFENADTRKRQRLGWINVQTGCDSRGYRKLMRDGEEGLKAYAVFIAMCQFMGTLKKEIRGEFRNSDGSLMDIYDISETTRISVADIQHATGRLAACGWITLLESVSDEESASDLPPICQSSPAFVQGKGKGKGEVKVQEDLASLSQEGEEPKPKKSKFTPPTTEEVNEYGRTRDGGFNDGEAFCDFYSSKGWMVGKNKMKDWKSAVRNWMRGKSYSSTTSTPVIDKSSIPENWKEKFQTITGTQAPPQWVAVPDSIKQQIQTQ